ncbi:MAG: WD40 domain-containing protein, partial [Patescibacteria group bacterium]|nr:WD40 domain-containing protein [Patescibacteria group bacterium]
MELPQKNIEKIKRELEKSYEERDYKRITEILGEIRRFYSVYSVRSIDYYYPRLLKEVKRKKNYRIVEVLEGHGYAVRTLQVLPDGRIVSGSYDRTIRVWEIDS